MISQTLEMLIKYNEFDIETIGYLERRPLHHAVIAAKHRALLMLLDNKATVDVKDKSLMTPLHYAAQSGRPILVWCLLQKGARVDIFNDQDKTPLMIAAEMGHVEIVQLFIDHKADLFLNNSSGKNALFFGVNNIKNDLQVIQTLATYNAEGKNRYYQDGHYEHFGMTEEIRLRVVQSLHTALGSALDPDIAKLFAVMNIVGADSPQVWELSNGLAKIPEISENAKNYTALYSAQEGANRRIVSASRAWFRRTGTT